MKTIQQLQQDAECRIKDRTNSYSDFQVKGFQKLILQAEKLGLQIIREQAEMHGTRKLSEKIAGNYTYVSNALNRIARKKDGHKLPIIMQVLDKMRCPVYDNIQ